VHRGCDRKRLRAAPYLSMAISMTSTDSSLLIVEDSGVLLAILMKWFNETFPEKSVLGVKSIAAAQEAVAAVPVDFFLVDYRLPDGTGLEFMNDVRTVSPQARFILMTLEMPDAECENLMALNPVGSFRKPIDFEELEWILRPHLEAECDTKASIQPARTVGFRTMLRGVLPVDLIQLKCLEKATCALEFRNSREDVGRVYLTGGEITHAETAGAIGIHALAEIIHWPDGVAREMNIWAPPVTVTIGSPWHAVLMEAAQLSDESRCDASPSPSEFQEG
jgi:CheY-like chemotaxis protein